MGESQKQAFQLSFNRFLRVAFQGSRVTSNGGLILVRELDKRRKNCARRAPLESNARILSTAGEPKS